MHVKLPISMPVILDALQVCHCISCRKTGGVYYVNLAAEKDSLQVEGRDAVKSFRQLSYPRIHTYTQGANIVL